MPARRAKRLLLNCNGCPTIKRIMKSTYDADGFMQIFQRMAVLSGSTPLKPHGLAGTAIRDVQRGGDEGRARNARQRQPEPEQTWAYPSRPSRGSRGNQRA